MARTPRPWYRADRKCWQVTIEGTRHTLAFGAKKNTRQAAEARFHELMRQSKQANRTSGIPRNGSLLIGDIVVAYERELQARQARGELSARALDDFRYRIAGFAERVGDTPAADVRPFMVLEWLGNRPTLGATSRHHAATAAKAVTRWAKRQGLIDADPLADMEKPPRRLRRELVMDAREAGKVINGMPPGPFRDLLTFLFETGCRPSEAARLEAEHLDASRGIAILSVHKTSAKTAKPRIIAMTPEALTLVQRLAKANPTGPLFRNTKGNAWTKDAINCAIRRLRRKTGIGYDFTAYVLRHGWATDALAAGEPVALVAEMLGHSDTRMLTSVYSHLIERTELFTEAANRVRSGKKPLEN
jgi:integrase